MAEQEHKKPNVMPIGAAAASAEKLPYRVELWESGGRAGVERVLARAFSATLARAIFKAAMTENPQRRITLRRGGKIVADSAA